MKVLGVKSSSYGTLTGLTASLRVLWDAYGTVTILCECTCNYYLLKPPFL